MSKKWVVWRLAGFLFIIPLPVLVLAGPALGQEQTPVPLILSFTGKVEVNGVPFSGKGHFKFALYDPRGNPVWSNDKSPLAPDQVPTSNVGIEVRQGIYLAPLGDESMGMPRLPEALRLGFNGIRLSVWFNDGKHGLHLVQDSQPLPATGTPNPSPEISSDGNSLRDEITLLRQELRSLAMQVRSRSGAEPRPIAQVRQPAPRPAVPVMVELPPPGGVKLGRDDAPLILVEFSEFQCPYCARFHLGTFPRLKTEYIDSGKLQFISRNLPLPGHSKAVPAAHAALCAGDQDAYWKFRDGLFLKPEILAAENWRDLSQELALDLKAFEGCLSKMPHADHLQSARIDAAKAGITGTPSFLLGKMVDDQFVAERIIGAQPFEQFQKRIEALLEPNANP